MWIPPHPARIWPAIDATWAPKRIWQEGPFTLREGAGGGSRVSAASRDGLVTEAEVKAAAAAMEAIGQASLFMVRDGDAAFDAMLDGLGYRAFDHVTVLAAPIEGVAGTEIPDRSGIVTERPMARAKEIWAKGGIGAARLAVMARVSAPSTYVLGRAGDRPAGAGFVAVDGQIAMLHALEIAEPFRRAGLGRAMTVIGARWAQEAGAKTFAVLTVNANAPALGLYKTLGFTPVTTYHYRTKT